MGRKDSSTHDSVHSVGSIDDSVHSVGSTGSMFLNKSMRLISQKLFFKTIHNARSGSVIAEGGDCQFIINGYRLSFDDNRPPEVVEGTEIYIEHQTQCLHPIFPGTQQETIYFEVLGCPVVGLTCCKATWKGPFGPFKDVVKLGDFNVGKHEFVYEPKQVPNSLKTRGHFKMRVVFHDETGRQLWKHKRRFRILKKSECEETSGYDTILAVRYTFATAIFVSTGSSWTNRILNGKDHASVQISVADVDEVAGKLTGSNTTFALSGYLRRIGEADEALASLISKPNE